MQALHYYIKNQSRHLRDEIEHISALLVALENEQDSFDELTYKSVKQELHNFTLRKQIELLNFNKQLIKKRFVLNEKAEEERIQNDITKLNNVLIKLKLKHKLNLFNRVLVYKKSQEPNIEDIGENDFITKYESGQLTIYWIENNKLVTRSFGETVVTSILEKLPAVGMVSTDTDLIKQIVMQYCPQNFNRCSSTSSSLTGFIQSLEEHKTHFASDGIATRIFDVAKKAIGLSGESWEAARGSLAGSSSILNEIGPAISGVFDSFTLVGETIVNLDAGIEAAEKYDIGTQLYKAKDNEIELNDLKEKYQLSDEKVNKYKTTDTEKQALLKQKDDLQLNRSVTGMTNGAVSIIGTASCWTTIGIGITSLLQSLGVIALPASTIGALSLAATGLSIVGPFTLAAIFANKLRHSRTEYDAQEKVTKAAKQDLANELTNTFNNKIKYNELKNKYETSSHEYAKTSNNNEEHKKFLTVYEKENIYRKEKQKLKSIGVEKVFSGIELSTSLFAVAGSTMIALSGIFSFGIAPTVILVAGSAIALGAAAFEYYDKKHGHKYTDAISNKLNQFKHWIMQDEEKSQKHKDKMVQKNQLKKQLKDKVKNSATSLIYETIKNKNDSKENFNHLDQTYDQLQGKEQKLFRHAAWEKIQNMTFASQDEELDFLLEARSHTVFNKQRGLRLFSTTTSTVDKIDERIAVIGPGLDRYEKMIEKENKTIRQQYIYTPHR